MPQDRNADNGGDYASPACMANEIAPDYFDPFAVDPQQARDVARWRKSERARLIAARAILPAAMRATNDAAIRAHLAALVGAPGGRVIAGFWPIGAEPDLRPLLASWHEMGAQIALPVVEVRAAPLVFRRWTSDTAMITSLWDIPAPPPDAPALIPDIILLPLVGWDGAGHRLGHGGGYYDRTLAALSPGQTIGIGYQGARIATIYPQPHDIALAHIVTEVGPQPLI